MLTRYHCIFKVRGLVLDGMKQICRSTAETSAKVPTVILKSRPNIWSSSPPKRIPVAGVNSVAPSTRIASCGTCIYTFKGVISILVLIVYLTKCRTFFFLKSHYQLRIENQIIERTVCEQENYVRKRSALCGCTGTLRNNRHQSLLALKSKHWRVTSFRSIQICSKYSLACLPSTLWPPCPIEKLGLQS